MLFVFSSKYDMIMKVLVLFFMERGFNVIIIFMIVEWVYVGIGMIYCYFDSKEIFVNVLF